MAFDYLIDFALGHIYYTFHDYFFLFIFVFSYNFLLFLSRLLLLLAPVASATVGVAFGYLIDFALNQILVRFAEPLPEEIKEQKSKAAKSFNLNRELKRLYGMKIRSFFCLFFLSILCSFPL